MKQYLLFSYDMYYPCGGHGDYAGEFDNLENILEYIGDGVYDDYDVLDIHTGVWSWWKKGEGMRVYE